MSKLLRVTQVNAIYLENEVNRVFQQLLQDTVKYLPPGYTAEYDLEIKLLIRIAILYYSIVKTGSSFGQQLLSLKYDNISTTQRYLYIIGNCFDYFKDKIETSKPSEESSQNLKHIYVALKLYEFVNLSLFLRNGTKPQLIERILGLNHVYVDENVQRQYNSKYLTRELVWNGFIEILVHTLPLINFHKIRRALRNYNPFHIRPVYNVVSYRTITMHTKCAHCNENPILPHHMGCAHVFCYVCLKGNQAADSKYECPICEHRNPNILCDRVTC